MDQLTETYEFISKENCLCSFPLDHIFNFIHPSSLKCTKDTDTSEYLLSTSIMRRIAEAYVAHCLKTSVVCKGILNFIHHYHRDDVWTEMVAHCSSIDDEYVQYNFIKGLAAIAHSFPTLLMNTRLEMLLNSVQKCSKEEQYCILELVISILNFNVDSCIKSDGNASNCDRVPCSASFEHVLPNLCLQLSEKWDTLKHILLKGNNPNTNTFLNLWNQLVEKHLDKGYSFSSPSPSVAAEFLSFSTKLSPISFQLYINITSQIFCSSYNSISSELVGSVVPEEEVLRAVKNGLLEHIPKTNSSLTFCSTIPSVPSSSLCETSIVMKKSIFVILNLLRDFKNASCIYEVLETLHLSAPSLIGIESCESDFSFIVDVFIGEDDLLFGAMFAMLKIYLFVKEDKSPKSCDIIRKLSPHRIFTKFLKLIGFNHTELLSFLTSDETCCLLYLLTYVKLFLCDFDSVVRVYQALDCKIHDNESKTQCKSNLKTMQDLKEPPSSMDTCLNSVNNVSLLDSQTTKLVLYSSSSSSDEESDTEVNTSCDTVENSEILPQRTLSVFLNLKEAIQKLVDINEFPYNATPLILLLRKCEKLTVQR